MTNRLLEGVVVTKEDCAKLGFCPSGIRRWMTQHGKDLRTFLRHGMPAEEMAALDDAHGNRAIEAAIDRTRNGQG